MNSFLNGHMIGVRGSGYQIDLKINFCLLVLGRKKKKKTLRIWAIYKLTLCAINSVLLTFDVEELSQFISTSLFF